jgi:diadenosine tetraphosphate (Ap4A) HIT family hydrolase
MSAWGNPAKWDALCSGESCPICVGGKPLDVVAEMEASWVTMSEDAVARGYVCLVSKVHVVELHELGDSQSESFMRDARRLSRAVAAATGALKLNYEIHGNTIPHLHMHIYPRYRGDAFEGCPIDPKAVGIAAYGAGEFLRIRDAVVEGL